MGCRVVMCAPFWSPSAHRPVDADGHCQVASCPTPELIKIKQKGCGECATAHNEQGTEGDLLDSVYRRTPRRQFANCIGDLEDQCVHQECVPFFRIFRTVGRSLHPVFGMCQAQNEFCDTSYGTKKLQKPAASSQRAASSPSQRTRKWVAPASGLQKTRPPSSSKRG